MSTLYSVIPGLTPTQQEILEAELLAKQILEAQFPDLDLREGTGLRDLVLRPVSYAFALLKKGTDNYLAQNTIASVDDTTDTTIVDDLLSNWFLTRNTGTYAVISARLYFARQKNITLPSSVYFSPDNSLKFYPVSTQLYQATNMGYDSYQNEWYIDVDLQAETTGSSYNLNQGSLLYFSTFDPYFLHGEINFLVQSSTDAETNTQFISRASTAISTRNLINVPSVTSNLQSAFNTLSRLHTVGMGDPDMIRDAIKVIIDPENSRTAVSLTQTGGVATLTLLDHGFQIGQLVNISGALPAGYNGQFAITGITENTFNFAVSSGLSSPATGSVSVQSYTAPTLVHTGGMVDVYCGDAVSTSVVQLTTDGSGIAQLTGPIYSYSRSSITGGSANDTIPYTTPVTISSSTLDVSGYAVHVTAPAHGLSTGTPVNVSGIVQTKTITSISCTNLVVTAVVTSHGLTTGSYVTVSGVTPSTYNGTFQITYVDANTFTYVLTANVLVAGSGTMLITNPSVDGVFTITSTGTNTFDIALPLIWSGATNSTTSFAVTYSVPYTVSNPYLQSKTITAINGTGTTATATLLNHGYAANRYVTITGATPSYYNGTVLITSIVSPTQFTYTTSSAILAPASGVINASYVIPWQDYGFSTKQVLNVNFGPSYANETASFNINYFSEVDAVQSYLELSDNHILCGDYLARGFNLYILDLNVVVYNGTAPTSGVVSDAATTYLATLSSGDTFVLSDLVAALNTAGVTNIQTPILVNYTKYHRDLITPITGIIADYLDPLDSTNVFLVGNVTTSSLSI